MEKHISPASPFVVNYGDCYACRKRPRHGEAKQQNRLDRLDRTHKRHSWPSHRDSHHRHTDDLGHVGDGRDVQGLNLFCVWLYCSVGYSGAVLWNGLLSDVSHALGRA